MSNPQQSKPFVSGTALVLAMAAVVLFIIAAIVVIAVAVPEGGNPGSLIAILIGSLAPTLAAIAAVAKIGNVAERVEQVAQDTADLSNGKMDAKILAGAADAVHPDMLNPAMGEQIQAARERRDSGH